MGCEEIGRWYFHIYQGIPCSEGGKRNLRQREESAVGQIEEEASVGWKLETPMLLLALLHLRDIDGELYINYWGYVVNAMGISHDLLVALRNL